MRVIVVANVEQQQEIALKNTNSETQLVFIKSLSECEDYVYDAIFYLLEDQEAPAIEKLPQKPVFINSVTTTLAEGKWPPNFSRINGWPGFLQRQTWEVAATDKVIAGKVFETLRWKVVFVSDEPGFVSARIISMIINEAFFALEEKVSSIDEMDLAMKLGTNYPYGPFEWKDKIGLQNIYKLLKRLSLTDKRYTVAPLLEKQYFELTDFQKM